MELDDTSWIFLSIIVLILGGILWVYTENSREGFQSGQSGFRCGVDLPTCNVGLKCLNGFCKKTSMPALPKNELSVYP